MSLNVMSCEDICITSVTYSYKTKANKRVTSLVNFTYRNQSFRDRELLAGQAITAHVNKRHREVLEEGRRNSHLSHVQARELHDK